jgi:hypothetical protein
MQFGQVTVSSLIRLAVLGTLPYLQYLGEGVKLRVLEKTAILINYKSNLLYIHNVIWACIENTIIGWLKI